MRPPMPSMRLSRRSKILFGIVATIVVLLILASSLSGYFLDYQWFGEVGQRGVFTSVLVTRIVLFAVFAVIMAVVIGVNLVIAYRLRPPFRPMSPEQQNLERYRNRIEPRRGLFLGLLLAFIGLVTGLSMQGSWQQWMLWMNGTSFGQKDPQFHLDVSFYAFDYPVYRAMLGFAFTAIVLAFLLSLVVHYVFGAVRLQTPGPKMTLAARRHLTVLVFVFVALKAVAYWLDRYELVFSDRGLNFNGASYTDINAALPAKTILFYVAIVIAIAVLASMWLRSVLIPGTAFVVLLVLSVLANGIYPAVVQQFKVKPNANQLEAQYIERNIEATRSAYGIVDAQDGGQVDYQQYDVTNAPDPTALNPANPTVANIRVLDPNVLSPTFVRQQRITQFYDFPPKLDIDRYTTTASDGSDVTRDYIVAARELTQDNLNQLGGNLTNWINNYTKYTHGFGFVAAAANTDITQGVNAGAYAEGGIPGADDASQSGELVDIAQPRIYYGEAMPDYSVVGGKGSTEYDAQNRTTTYSGRGGVALGSLTNRLAAAVHYRQLSFLLNDAATGSGAKLIFDRDPRERVEKVAPFLKVDGDPYPAVIGGHIVWMLDGYTTSANFPYSQRQSLADLTADSLTAQNRAAALPDDTINYIRNSVKATVDAYDGTVTLYQWGSADPVLETWMKAFPGLVKPQSDMPADVQSHIRYPQDLFAVQRNMLQRYHVSDPSQFYSSTQQWQVPTDPTVGTPTGTTAPDQPPYYIQASSPLDPDSTSADSQFQLTSPMNLPGNTNPALAAYVSVNSSPGDDYGKMTVLEVPDGTSYKAPERAYADFNANAVVANDLNRLRSGESTIKYGNLLTLPIGNSFLYVEPLYVQASGANGFPQLQRVLVAYGDRIAYEPTLAQALEGIADNVVGRYLDTTTGTGGTTPTSPSPTPTGSSTSTPSSTPTTGGSTSQQLETLRTEIADLAVQINTANREGNYTLAGQLSGQLAQKAAQYAQLQAQASGGSTPSSAGSSGAGATPSSGSPPGGTPTSSGTNASPGG